jgi:DNA-binding CsgD family transcriptional regulator
MKVMDASGGETTVGVILAAEHLAWLAEAVTSRGGRLLLELRPGTLRQRARPEASPLTPAEQDAVRAAVEQDSWAAAAAALGITPAALRARLRSACRRLGIASEARLIALCLARGWVPPSE